jgi:hypothetical protein
MLILDGSKFVSNVTGLDPLTFRVELELSLEARCFICLVYVEESIDQNAKHSMRTSSQGSCTF